MNLGSLLHRKDEISSLPSMSTKESEIQVQELLVSSNSRDASLQSRKKIKETSNEMSTDSSSMKKIIFKKIKESSNEISTDSSSMKRLFFKGYKCLCGPRNTCLGVSEPDKYVLITHSAQELTSTSSSVEKQGSFPGHEYMVLRNERNVFSTADGNSCKFENTERRNQKKDQEASCTLKDTQQEKAEKTTYCRPVTHNYINEQYILKTIERNNRLQNIVKKLIEVRQREKHKEAWNNFINDLKSKHGLNITPVDEDEIISDYSNKTGICDNTVLYNPVQFVEDHSPTLIENEQCADIYEDYDPEQTPSATVYYDEACNFYSNLPLKEQRQTLAERYNLKINPEGKKTHLQKPFPTEKLSIQRNDTFFPTQYDLLQSEYDEINNFKEGDRSYVIFNDNIAEIENMDNENRDNERHEAKMRNMSKFDFDDRETKYDTKYETGRRYRVPSSERMRLNDGNMFIYSRTSDTISDCRVNNKVKVSSKGDDNKYDNMPPNFRANKKENHQNDNADVLTFRKRYIIDRELQSKEIERRHEGEHSLKKDGIGRMETGITIAERHENKDKAGTQENDRKFEFSSKSINTNNEINLKDYKKDKQTSANEVYISKLKNICKNHDRTDSQSTFFINNHEAPKYSNTKYYKRTAIEQSILNSLVSNERQNESYERSLEVDYNRGIIIKEERSQDRADDELETENFINSHNKKSLRWSIRDPNERIIINKPSLIINTKAGFNKNKLYSKDIHSSARKKTDLEKNVKSFKIFNERGLIEEIINEKCKPGRRYLSDNEDLLTNIVFQNKDEYQRWLAVREVIPTFALKNHESFRFSSDRKQDITSNRRLSTDKTRSAVTSSYLNRARTAERGVKAKILNFRKPSGRSTGIDAHIFPKSVARAKYRKKSTTPAPSKTIDISRGQHSYQTNNVSKTISPNTIEYSRPQQETIEYLEMSKEIENTERHRDKNEKYTNVFYDIANTDGTSQSQVVFANIENKLDMLLQGITELLQEIKRRPAYFLDNSFEEPYVKPMTCCRYLNVPVQEKNMRCCHYRNSAQEDKAIENTESRKNSRKKSTDSLQAVHNEGKFSTSLSQRDIAQKTSKSRLSNASFTSYRGPSGQPEVIYESERRESKRRESGRLESERRESERRQSERQEPERWESERREPERREPERRESERPELKRRESERRQSERQEPERWESDRRETGRREPERREPERRESGRRESKKQELERRQSESQEAEIWESERRAKERRDPERREPKRREPERQEPERRESERRESKRREPERRELERQEPERRVTLTSGKLDVAGNTSDSTQYTEIPESGGDVCQETKSAQVSIAVSEEASIESDKTRVSKEDKSVLVDIDSDLSPLRSCNALKNGSAGCVCKVGSEINKEWRIKKKDQVMCTIVANDCSPFCKIQTCIGSKIDKILIEEMDKSDQAKRDIEDILNGECSSTCAVKLSFDLPTRDHSTEVTDSLSRTEVCKCSDSRRSIRSIRSGNIDAVNTDPLRLLSLFRISTGAIRNLLNQISLNYSCISSYLPLPAISNLPTAIQTTVPDYVCKICGDVFEKSNEMIQHQIYYNHLGTSTDCCVCRHVLDTRRRRPVGLFTCSYCGQRFTRAYCCELHSQICARRRGLKHDVPENLAILT